MASVNDLIQNVSDVDNKNQNQRKTTCRNKVCNSLWPNLIQNLLFVESLPTQDKNKQIIYFIQILLLSISKKFKNK